MNRTRTSKWKENQAGWDDDDQAWYYTAQYCRNDNMSKNTSDTYFNALYQKIPDDHKDLADVTNKSFSRCTRCHNRIYKGF